MHPSSSPSDFVSAELIHDAPLVYHYLAYTWGDPSKTKPTLVNEHNIDATESLVNALVQLRGVDMIAAGGRTRARGQEYHRNEYTWIHAVRTAQKDGNEEASQVRQLRDTYAQAEQVDTSYILKLTIYI